MAEAEAAAEALNSPSLRTFHARQAAVMAPVPSSLSPDPNCTKPTDNDNMYTTPPCHTLPQPSMRVALSGPFALSTLTNTISHGRKPKPFVIRHIYFKQKTKAEPWHPNTYSPSLPSSLGSLPACLSIVVRGENQMSAFPNLNHHHHRCRRRVKR